MVQSCLIGGSIHTPFEQKAKVVSRGYSTVLQRRIVDLAADVSFGEAARKVKEHYSIEVPVSSIQRITKAHAQRASDRLERLVEAATRDENVDSGLGVGVLIAETDGTMVPIVSFSEDVKQQGNDCRKQR